MPTIFERCGAKASPAGRSPAVASAVASLLADDRLADVTLRRVGDRHVLHWHAHHATCADQADVLATMRAWAGMTS